MRGDDKTLKSIDDVNSLLIKQFFFIIEMCDHGHESQVTRFKDCV